MSSNKNKTKNKSRWNISLSKHQNYDKSISPPGYYDNFSIYDDNSKNTSNRERLTKKAELKAKKAWEIAKSPLGSIFMTGFMLWLSGSSINIFSISMTMYALINPLKSIFNLSSSFKRFEDSNTSLLPQKLLYILLQLVALGIALYKANSMGILPSEADWSSYLAVKPTEEYSSGILIF